MVTGNIMRYNLPKNDIIDTLKYDTEEFFAGNGIDVKNLSNSIYLDILCAAVITALDYFLEYRSLPDNEMMKTLNWVSGTKRKEKEQMSFYCYQKYEEQITLAVARLRVQVENKNVKHIEQKEIYFDRLMTDYEFYVLDDLDIKLKQLLTQLIGSKESWGVFEVMQYRRGIELINYGDFRVLTWEMNRTN